MLVDLQGALFASLAQKVFEDEDFKRAFVLIYGEEALELAAEHAPGHHSGAEQGASKKS